MSLSITSVDSYSYPGRHQCWGRGRRRVGPILLLEVGQRRLQVGQDGVRELLLLPQAVADRRAVLAHEPEELGLPLRDLLDRHVVEEALGAGVDAHDLVLD